MNCVGVGKILETGQWDEVYVPPHLATPVLRSVPLWPPAGMPPAPCPAISSGRATSAPLTRTSRPRRSRPRADGTAGRQPGPVPGGAAGSREDRGPVPGAAGGRAAGAGQPVDPRLAAHPGCRRAAERGGEVPRAVPPLRPGHPRRARPRLLPAGPAQPFMAIAVPATNLAREKSPPSCTPTGPPACRPARADNPFLADVLDRFTELTRVPVLINTRSTSRASRSAVPRRWPPTAWPPAGWTG